VTKAEETGGVGRVVDVDGGHFFDTLAEVVVFSAPP